MAMLSLEKLSPARRDSKGESMALEDQPRAWYAGCSTRLSTLASPRPPRELRASMYGASTRGIRTNRGTNRGTKSA
ncbi:MAG TPA: hypothetical protein VGP93_19600 [Polyangiaceae bacterium]|nr:hypothetical protein [Polyangiaceae bacterium]